MTPLENLKIVNPKADKSILNDLGLKDSNSTPGNKANGENDMGSADVIVSIRTGGVIYMTIGIVIAVVLVAGITAGIIVKRKNLKGEE